MAQGSSGPARWTVSHGCFGGFTNLLFNLGFQVSKGFTSLIFLLWALIFAPLSFDIVTSCRGQIGSFGPSNLHFMVFSGEMTVWKAEGGCTIPHIILMNLWVFNTKLTFLFLFSKPQ